MDTLSAVFEPSTPFHFVGIGGVGMSGLAEFVLSKGYSVSGSDLKGSPRTDFLQAHGAQIYLGEPKAYSGLQPNTIVVLSTAIREGHPEWEQAKVQGNLVLHRSDLLQQLCEAPAFGFENSVGLTGTHGKTTLTGMVGLALQAAQQDPTIIAGGKIPGFPTNARLGDLERWVVAELDESDGTIVKYNPTTTVVANLELDHADHFSGGIDEIVTTFQHFVSHLAPRSSETQQKKLILNVDCAKTASLKEFAPPSVQVIPVSYEFGNTTGIEPQYWLEDIECVKATGGYHGTVVYQGKPLGRLQLSVPGWHNLLNALLTSVVGHEAGLPFEPMANALNQFSGMGRRFEVVGHYQGALLVDDYAHHPTEVRAILRAAAERLGPRGALTAIFQPHRFTRLQALWEEFVHSFGQADLLIVTDVYGAGESPIEEVDAKTFVRAVASEGVLRPDKIRYIPRDQWDTMAELLHNTLKANDVVITMGAGDITQFLRTSTYFPQGEEAVAR